MAYQRKLALLTGASSGIGRATALELAKSNYDLIVAARRTTELQSLAEEIKSKHNVIVEVRTVDLTQAESAELLFKGLTHLDVLINCAGIGTYGLVEEQNESHWTQMFNVNCLSVLSASRLAISLMKNGGAIINVSSLASDIPIPYMAVYSASKAFVTQLSIAMNEELKPRKIKVVSVNPGGVRTEFIARAGMSEQINKDQSHMLVSPEYIAKAIVKAINGSCAVVVPLRSGYLARTALWLLPRTLKARLAGRTYAKYLS